MQTVNQIGLLTLCLTSALLAQIAQDHPELCGNEAHIVPVPANVSATIDRGDSKAMLTLQMNGSAKVVELPGAEEIRQVCPIPQKRLIIFEWDRGFYNVTILDEITAAAFDHFLAYDPVMSPDQHWLVMRQFYPLHGELTLHFGDPRMANLSGCTEKRPL